MNRTCTVEPMSPTEIFRKLVKDGDEPAVSLLGAVMDGHLLLGKENVSTQTPACLFEMWWPDRSFAETLSGLIQLGLLTAEPCGVCVPQKLRGMLIEELIRYVSDRPVEVAGASIAFGEILEGFERCILNGQQFCHPVQVPAVTWGEMSYLCDGRIHRLLHRPYPLLLQPHDRDFILKICKFPREGIQNITKVYAESRPLRDRFALYDLGCAEKINLTRSSVFVLFERYIRQEHSLRIGSACALSECLSDAGILNLQMG